jgi:hypothetical protein
MTKYFRNLRVSAAVGLPIAICTAAAGAHARRVAVDSPEEFKPCAPGQPCLPFTLETDIDYGSGPQRDLYIYNNGVVSIGKELTVPLVPVSNLSDYGQDVFSPGYFPGAGFNTFYEQQSATTIPGTSSPYITVQYFVDGGEVQFGIRQTPSNGPNGFTLFFAQGFQVNDPDFGPYILFEVTPPTRIGYYLNGVLNETTAGAASDEIADPNGFTYVFPGTVPDPATWAMMILGFGLAGAGLRRRSPLPAWGPRHSQG